jgi:hypothetical protein
MPRFGRSLTLPSQLCSFSSSIFDRHRLKRVMGGDVRWQDDAGSPGSDGASPYRRTEDDHDDRIGGSPSIPCVA